MSTATIHCQACERPMRLAQALLDRLQGRTGKVPCKSCGARLRLDARGDELVVELVDGPPPVEAAARKLPQSGSLPPPLPVKPVEPPVPVEPLVPVEPPRDREGFLPARASLGSLSPHTLEEPARAPSVPPLSGDDAFDLQPKTSRVGRTPLPPRPWQLSRRPGSEPDTLELPPLSHGPDLSRGSAPDMSLFAQPPRRYAVKTLLLSTALLLGAGIAAGAVVRNTMERQGAATAAPAVSSVARRVFEEPLASEQPLLLIGDGGRSVDLPEVHLDAPGSDAPTDSARSGSSPQSVDAQRSKAASSGPPSAADGPDPKVEPALGDGSGAFDKSAASLAMQEATARASGCRQEGDPSGVSRVVVTFAPSGRATRATISGPPFAGTSTGGCIAREFQSTRVPAFDGQHVTVVKTVTVR